VQLYIFLRCEKLSEGLGLEAGRYDLWLNQVCESEGSLRRYRQDIEGFEKWARAKHDLIVSSVPSMWREAKYSGKEAEKEMLLDRLKDIIADYFAYLKKDRGITPFSINRSMAVVMSYFHYYELPLRSVRIRHPTVEFHNRDILKEEVQKILDHSDVRNKAVFLMLYETGMRPDTLVQLRWSQIKEDFIARRLPMKILLPSKILKCGVSDRFVFIGDNGFEALSKYLNVKRQLPLKDSDFVFVTEKPYGKQLGTHAISQAFNVLVKDLKLAESRDGKPKELRLYALKKAFQKFMVSKVDRSLIEFWIGHTGTATHYVPQDPEYHRKAYAEGYSELILEPTERIGLKDLQEQVKQKDQEIKELKEKIDRYEDRFKNLEKEKAEVLELRDRLVEVENQLYADRRLFEKALGITDQEESEIRREQMKSRSRVKKTDEHT
jgi:integrase